MEDMVRDMEERYVTDLRRDCSVQVVVAGSSRIDSGLWKWCCEVQEREREREDGRAGAIYPSSRAPPIVLLSVWKSNNRGGQTEGEGEYDGFTYNMKLVVRLLWARVSKTRFHIDLGPVLWHRQ
jgi:hypothetical protein